VAPVSWREWGAKVDLEVLPKAGKACIDASKAAILYANRAKAMETSLRYLTVLALIAVLLVLLAGLWNMMRGTSPNLSQTLMRWRVGLQFLAIVIAMILVYLLRK
jgi:Mg2+ and Co2+ transporter CorA